MFDNLKYTLALKTAVILGLAAAFPVYGTSAEVQAETDPCVTGKTPTSIVVLQVSGYFTEKPGANFLSLSDESTNNIRRFSETLGRAADDDNIKAVVLNIEQPLLSWAQVDELRRNIKHLRDSGKKTYAYVETMSQRDYLLACACDEIIITPTGTVLVVGLAGEAVYFKNLLDKIGVKADFMQMGRFKSAAESLTRTGPSEAELLQINRLFDSLHEHLLNSIAASRKMEPEQVAKIIDEGPFTAEEAKQAGLIDRIMYRPELLQYLKEQTAGEVQLVLNYEKSDRSKINLDNPFALMAVLQEIFSGPKEPTGDVIAVVYVDGPITLGQSSDGWADGTVGARTVRMAVNEAANDNNVKAIVVRIDSPGGGATASDIIYRSVRKAAESKPVVISMGRVAASGGYYIACGGPTILAEASTITGSIGVVGGKLVIGGLFEKLGITTYTFKRGRHADLFNSTRAFTPLERYKLARIMRDVYGTFKQCVVESRGEKLQGLIENLAQGKVYTGLQAKKLGLIDNIGGLDDAIELAARQAGIEEDGEYKLRTLPRPKTIMDLLDNLLAQAGTPDNNPSATLGKLYNLSQYVSWFSGNLPKEQLNNYSLRKAWRQALSFGTMLRQEQTLFILPCEIMIF